MLERKEETMNSPAYLQKQFANFNAVLHGIAGDLTDEEWVARPGPGQNMLGYSVWHIPRTQDNFLQAWIRGQDEIVRGERWAHWDHLKPLGIGVGIRLEEADSIAHSVNLADVMAYADEVHQTITTWLAEISEDVLDSIPDARAHLAAFPEYQTPGYREEVHNLYDLPVWGLLIRPCMGHVHRHLGEVDIIKDVLRKAKVTATP